MIILPSNYSFDDTTSLLKTVKFIHLSFRALFKILISKVLEPDFTPNPSSSSLVNVSFPANLPPPLKT